MSTDMLLFEDYKALVESCTLTDDAGTWHITLSDIAKAPGDFVLEYHYDIYQQRLDGTRFHVIVFPPAQLRAIGGDENIFDGRVQLSPEDLMSMLATAQEIAACQP